jgi:hypothetical protein
VVGRSAHNVVVDIDESLRGEIRAAQALQEMRNIHDEEDPAREALAGLPLETLALPCAPSAL